jgi:hypothetical protein
MREKCLPSFIEPNFALQPYRSFRREANSTKDALGGKEHLEIERSHHHNFTGN